MALICASAPAMKGFFLKIGESVSSRYGSKNSSAQRSRGYGRSFRNDNDTPSSDTYKLTPLTGSSSNEHWTEKTGPGATEKVWTKQETAMSPGLPTPTYHDATRFHNMPRDPRVWERERGREREIEREEAELVRLHRGIHVEQRWSVTSYDPRDNERKAKRMF